jgi:N-acetyl-anhydromuramyl-L-alanine amidase AmpD
MLNGIIIVDGQKVPIDAVVHDWYKTGLEFKNRPKRRSTRVVVNHWTAAENRPEQMFEYMHAHKNLAGKSEPLSVHFAVDALGELWQFMDASSRGAHCVAHGANDWSVGIEFICRGDNFAAPQKGIVRTRSTGVIHGSLVAYDDLTRAQVRTGIVLNEALCKAYSLPLQVPEKNGDVYATELPDKYIERLQGSVTHYMLELKKRDNGLTFIRELRDHYRTLSSPTPRGVA